MMPRLQNIGSVRGPPGSAVPAVVTEEETEQPGPAGTYDTEDFNVTGFSK